MKLIAIYSLVLPPWGSLYVSIVGVRQVMKQTYRNTGDYLTLPSRHER
jgi:hypothetical protein